MSVAPLKVQFTLRGHMPEAAYPLHLDAILAYSKVEESGVGDFSAQDDLPLARHEQGGLSVWKSSMLHVTGHHDGLRMLVRYTDVDDIALEQGRLVRMRASSVSTGSGPHRNYQIFYPVMNVSTAVAYCVGDAKEIKRLLGHIKYIGRLRRLGYGEVVGITIEEDASANHRWMERVLPWEPEDISGYRQGYCAYKPPYWKHENRHACWVFNEL